MDSSNRFRRLLASATFFISFIVTSVSPPAMSASIPQVLEEVIVSAQKREQSLQDTSIAISVLNGKQLELQGVTSLGGLSGGAIPSLRVMPLGNTPSNLVIAIRGNAPADASEVTREGSVAVYLDGVYLGRSHGLGMEFVDLERIEVLRGPQGSLFGRNAVGGAVSLVSKEPSGKFGIKQHFGLGRYDQFRSASHINFPELNGFSVKLDYLHTARDGWVRNTAPDQSDYNEYHKDGGRLSVNWKINDTLIADYSYDQADVSTAQNYFQFYKARLGIFSEELTRQTQTRLPVMLKPTVSKHKGHVLILNWQANEYVTLKSISSRRELREDAFNNYAGVLYFNGLIDASFMEQEQYTQELQLIGNQDSLQWTLGAYYFDEDVHKILQDRFSLDIFGVFGSALSPIDPPTTFDALGARAELPPRIVDAEAGSKAVYGQFNWTPPIFYDDLQITLGARYTKDKKSATRFETTLSEAYTKSAHVDINLAFDYYWRDGISTYAKWSTGYKAGGVNTRSASFKPYGEEIASTYELGLKSEFWQRRARFNLAMFRTRYQDMQLDFTHPVIITVVETINAERDVEVNGFEVDLTFLPLTGLALGFNYSYLDSHMPRQPNPLSQGSLKEFFVPLAPKHSGAFTLDYRFELWNFGTFVAHIDVTSTDHYSYTPFGEQRTDAYTLLNGRLSLFDIRLGRGLGSLSVSLWGKNLRDEEYIINAFPVGDPAISIGQAFGDPRTLGVDLSYEF